jgi:hypothetical protein
LQAAAFALRKQSPVRHGVNGGRTGGGALDGIAAIHQKTAAVRRADRRLPVFRE